MSRTARRPYSVMKRDTARRRDKPNAKTAERTRDIVKRQQTEYKDAKRDKARDKRQAWRRQRQAKRQASMQVIS